MLPVVFHKGQLSPLLFTAYINDIVTVVQNATIKLFADDTKLYFKAERNELNQALLDDLQRVFDWCSSWQLDLALSKCTVLQIRGCHADTIVPEYVVNGTTLPVVEHAKDLSYHVTAKPQTCLPYQPDH